jgi:hypothetical protein
MKTWLKGGLIGMFLFFITFFGGFIFFFGKDAEYTSKEIFFLFIILFVYIVVGVLISWIINKIKYKSWLKGGLIASLISSSFYLITKIIIFLAMRNDIIDNSIISTVLFIPILILALPIIFFLGLLEPTGDLIVTRAGFGFSLIFPLGHLVALGCWFLTGAIIGWIIGQIKSRNRDSKISPEQPVQ